MAQPTRLNPEAIAGFFREGEWLPLTLFDVWHRNAERYPDREAVVDEKRRYTWEQTWLAIRRLALGLSELGFRKDDILVVQLPNQAELPLIRTACEMAGVMCLPVLRNLRHKEIEYIMGRLKAAGIMIPWKYRGFDYFEMATQLKPGLPEFKHILVFDDQVPRGTGSVRGMLDNPLERTYAADYLRDKSYRPEEV